MKPMDYTPLSTRVTFREAMAADASGFFVGTLILLGVIIVGDLLLYAITGEAIMLATPAILVLVLVFAAIALYRGMVRSVRLTRLATANGLNYARRMPYDGRQGLIFNEGHTNSKMFLDMLYDDNDEVGFGNYRYAVGSGRNRHTYILGFARIKLARHLPNMVLDAKSNNSFGASNLPVAFSRNQKISLEGDFDKYFTLYAPAEYQIDALSIFTPDVMQVLIDLVGKYDCEIIDNYLYIYSSLGFRFDVDQMMALEKIITKLGSEINHQSITYADSRVGNRSVDAVAAGGFRLKRGISGSAIVVSVILIIYMVLSMLSQFFSK